MERLRLKPGAAQAGANPGRPISRPAVMRHLRLLEAQGVISARTRRGHGSPPTREYVADRARLYALLEDLRNIAQLGSTAPFEVAPTYQASQTPPAHWPTGPKLVLIRGAYEGKAFSLVGRRDHVWSVGRRRGSAISLDYDPYVSMDHCRIAYEQGALSLTAIATAKNGTLLNWKLLPPGSPTPLRSGDVISVGRSLLLFRED